MNALLVRIGADRSEGGGCWNGPVDSSTGKFVYVPIPENRDVYPSFKRPYKALLPALAKFDTTLPVQLLHRHMHLDPDFELLTYGDQGERAKQIHRQLITGDLIVFYAGLADIRGAERLVYALVGLLVIDRFALATDVPKKDRDVNAHTRRILKPGAQDLIAYGQPGVSGRFEWCIPIGEYRDRAYRVRPELVEEWGGLSVRDGYLHRSARLPRFLKPERFLQWVKRRNPVLLQSNN
jgi:hypothetical protein